MTSSPALGQSLRDTVIGSIQTLSQTPPSWIGDPFLLRRLSQLSSGISSETAHSLALQPSLSQAVDLTALTQQALSILHGLDHSGLNAETLLYLEQALDELARQLGASLRKEQAHRVRGLYVIIDPEVTGGRDPLEVAAAALKGGAKMLQLRDKLRDKGESLPLAQALQELCTAHDALLIINDHLDLAVAVGSGGVHVGQTDLPVAEARRVLAPSQVLGRSNREFQQLVQSQEMGADHVAFGPIYQTSTKSIVRNPQGIERLKQARAVAKVPLVAIGGINLENVASVVEAGADAICVTAAVGAAPDPEAAASRMVEAIQAAGGKV